MSDENPVNVLCMKWGTLYGPESCVGWSGAP